MAATGFTRTITEPLMAIGIAQYPIYGIMLDWARYAGRLKLGLLALAGSLVGVDLAFLISNRSFTP
jgi:hypothetical protein